MCGAAGQFLRPAARARDSTRRWFAPEGSFAAVPVSGGIEEVFDFIDPLVGVTIANLNQITRVL